MTDDGIVDNLRSEEVTGDDNGDDVDEEENNTHSHSDDFQALDLVIAQKEWQEKCDPVQLLEVIWLQGTLLTQATKQKTVLDFIN